MDIVLTLVVNPERSGDLNEACRHIESINVFSDINIHVLAKHCSIDITFKAEYFSEANEIISGAMAQYPHVDWCLQPDLPARRKRMLIADMDSTMITVECIDELADFVGAKEQVSRITEAAMRGELDFEDALKERVALLRGLPTEKLETCYRERIKIMHGAKALVQTMAANGAFTALVSGGFTFFTERVSAEIGFKDHRANTLEINEGSLTGCVVEPICGASAKLEALHEYCDDLGLTAYQVLAVGDGANDIPMLQAAGLGVAYHAKPKTAAATHAAVRNGDLSTLLYFQGYARDEFVGL